MPADGTSLTRSARHHGFRTIAIALASALLSGSLCAQLRLSGQASSSFIKSGENSTQYAYNDGRGTFGWRADLFGDAVIAENVSFHGSVRMLQDQVLHVDLLSIAVGNITPLDLTLEAGEIDIPIGDPARHRYPADNPFLNLPLMNEHRTSLRNYTFELWPHDATYTSYGNGVRLLDQGLYDIGAKLSGSLGVLDYAFALINGTPNQTSTYGASGLRVSQSPGRIIRLAVTPQTGFSIGVSGAAGSLSNSTSGYGDPSAGYAESFDQRLAEGDVTFEIGHLSLYGQVLYNVWKSNGNYHDDLEALGYSMEGSYTVIPRFSLAARIGGLNFNSITADLPASYGTTYPFEGRWDHDVVQSEAAVRYRITRGSLLKLFYQWTNTVGLSPDAIEQLIGGQLVVSF